jgi:hypothetical protein
MHRPSFVFAFAAVLALALVRDARGEEAPVPQGKPFQLALFNPVQIVSDEQGVSGVAINILYGKNAFLRGIELGLVNYVAGDAAGAQWGIVNVTGANHLGLQDAFVSITHGKIEGLQLGLVTVAGSTSGFQVGLVNHATNARGLQFGLVNHAVTMNGLQIGIVNVIEQGGWLPVTIIVNGSFP